VGAHYFYSTHSTQIGLKQHLKKKLETTSKMPSLKSGGKKPIRQIKGQTKLDSFFSSPNKFSTPNENEKREKIINLLMTDLQECSGIEWLRLRDSSSSSDSPSDDLHSTDSDSIGQVGSEGETTIPESPDFSITPGQTEFSMTTDEYIGNLFEAIEKAEKSIIISTKKINLTGNLKKFKSQLYTLLYRAKNKKKLDVLVLFSNIDQNSLGILKFFKEQNIYFEQKDISENFVIIDDHYISLGSHSWLSNPELDYKSVSAFTIQGEASESFIHAFKKRYQIGFLTATDWNKKSTSFFTKIDEMNELSLLTMSEDHHYFLENISSQAKSITIFCPMVFHGYNHTGQNYAKQTLETLGIDSALRTNKKLLINLVFEETNPYLGEIKKNRDKFNIFDRPRCRIKTTKKRLSQNLLIADDNFVALGAHGWSQENNAGASFVLHGPQASEVITRITEELLQSE
jgi:hypothetical protein